MWRFYGFKKIRIIYMLNLLIIIFASANFILWYLLLVHVAPMIIYSLGHIRAVVFILSDLKWTALTRHKLHFWCIFLSSIKLCFVFLFGFSSKFISIVPNTYNALLFFSVEPMIYTRPLCLLFCLIVSIVWFDFCYFRALQFLTESNF